MSDELADIIESHPEARRRYYLRFGRLAFVVLGLVTVLVVGLVLVLVGQHAHVAAWKETFSGYVRSSPTPDLAAIAVLLCPSRDCDFSSPSAQLTRSLSNTIPGVTMEAGFTVTSGGPNRSLTAFALEGHTTSGVTVLCSGQRLVPDMTLSLPIIRSPQDGISLVTNTAMLDRGSWQLSSQVVGGSYNSLPLKSAQLWLAQVPIPNGD